jgi:hypothetical protein
MSCGVFFLGGGRTKHILTHWHTQPPVRRVEPLMPLLLILALCAVRLVVIICCYLLFYLQLCSCMYVVCSTCVVIIWCYLLFYNYFTDVSIYIALCFFFVICFLYSVFCVLSLLLYIALSLSLLLLYQSTDGSHRV